MRRASSGTTGDSARESANARREAVTALSKIAEGLLLGGDYGATRDMLRRVTTTLEALSSYGSLPNAPSAGRLTDDVEPPGFEAMVGIPSGGKKTPAREPAAHTRSPSPALAAKPARAAQRAAQRAEEERKRLLAATKAAVRDAERALTVARKQAERAAARLDAATAESNDRTRLRAVASAERALESARRRLPAVRIVIALALMVTGLGAAWAQSAPPSDDHCCSIVPRPRRASAASNDTS